MIETLINAIRRTEQSDEDNEDAGAQADPLTPDEAHVTSVSPSSVLTEGKTMRAGNRWSKVLFVADWPDTARPGMLEGVTNHKSSEVTVSIHLEPWDQQRAIKRVTSAIRDLKKKRHVELEAGNPSEATKRRLKEHQEILAQLEDGKQSMFDVSAYIAIRAPTKDRVEKLSRTIANKLGERQVRVTSPDYRMDAALSSASPIAKDVLAHDLPNVSTTMLGRGAGTLFPFSATTIVEESGVFYGQHRDTNAPVIIDRFERPNGYNIFTAGEIGAGKSYGTKLLNLRTVAKDRDTLLIMLDPMDGFRELADGLNAERVVVDGTRGLNPLEIRPTPAHILNENPQLDPFRQTFQGAMGFFEGFFETVDDASLDKTERSVLSEALRTAYHRQGITRDPATHHLPSPTVLAGPGASVMGVLREIEDDAGAYLSEIQGEDGRLGLEDAPAPSERSIETWENAASNLRIAMHPFKTSEYAHLAGQSDIDIHGAQATYLDLQQGEGDHELGMMMRLLLDIVYQRIKQTDKRAILCIDEAHYLMQQESSLDWIERLTRHSRHHDLSLHLVTQKASDFLVNEQAKTIADNCSQKILHRLPGLSDEHAGALGLTEREAEFVRHAKPGTEERGYSEALVSVEDDATLPVKIRSYDKEEALIEGDDGTGATPGQNADSPESGDMEGRAARSDGGNPRGTDGETGGTDGQPRDDRGRFI